MHMLASMFLQGCLSLSTVRKCCVCAYVQCTDVYAHIKVTVLTFLLYCLYDVHVLIVFLVCVEQELCMKSYSSQLARIHIDNFLFKVMETYPELGSFAGDAPVTSEPN